MTKERINKLEGIWIETSQTENKKKIINMGQNIPQQWDNYKRCNTGIMGIPGGEERERGIEDIFKVIMAENFPKSITKMKPQI